MKPLQEALIREGSVGAQACTEVCTEAPRVFGCVCTSMTALKWAGSRQLSFCSGAVTVWAGEGPSGKEGERPGCPVSGPPGGGQAETRPKVHLVFFPMGISLFTYFFLMNALLHFGGINIPLI